jgi:peptide/nickel transport system permease protein
MWLIVRRASFSVFALFIISFLLFLLTNVVPGSPASAVLDVDASLEEILSWEREHNLHLPVTEQYWIWLCQILSGDLGESFITDRDLATEIKDTLPITLEWVTLGFGLAIIVGIPLGVASALNPNSWIDHIARVVAMTGISVPDYWIALMLISFVSVGLGWFPPGGHTPLSAGIIPHIKSLVLPVITLSLHYTAVFSRYTRSSMLDVLSQDYIRTARAMGLGRIRIWIYALKNSLPPVINVGAMSFGFSFGHALFIEHVFGIAGLSLSLLNAINELDYPMIQLNVLIVTIIFILANLSADCLNFLINPRLRRQT